jgi:hypothetical protein
LCDHAAQPRKPRPSGLSSQPSKFNEVLSTVKKSPIAKCPGISIGKYAYADLSGLA